MNGLCRMADVSMGANKEKLNALKTKGLDTILTTVSISTDGCEGLESVAGYGNDIMSIGLKWCIKLDMEGLYQSVLSEVGADSRMFIRKAERASFENVHKLFSRVKEVGAVPEFVMINIDIYAELGGLSLRFEEQTRVINAVTNAVKAACPNCKVIFSTKDSTDNEKAKKWFNRYQVAGGKGFDIISLSYELNSETFYDLSCNMSDLSRRFDAFIIVDISSQDDVSSSDIGLADLDSAISIVPMDKGFGTIYSDKLLDVVGQVA